MTSSSDGIGAAPRTLFDKLWSRHVVMEHSLAGSLLYIDRHILHEGSRLAFRRLEGKGLGVRRPALTVGTADHYTPSRSRLLTSIESADRRSMVEDLSKNAQRFGIENFDLTSPLQGIVHVIGPELGLSQPGMTVVCGDSHTATHGALGALAFGVGASQIAHVMATQTLWQKKPRQMRVNVSGTLAPGVTAKDLVLTIIGEIGVAGGSNFAIEYAGSAVRALSVEARMTLCNMTIEAGSKYGVIAPDEKTIAYVANRVYGPSNAELEDLSKVWLDLATDDGAAFDQEIEVDGSAVRRMITWGTSPEDVVTVDGSVPDPSLAEDEAIRTSKGEALRYMGLRPGTPVSDISFDRVFLGSCTNGRIEDLREAAAVLVGKSVAIPMIVVPGSMTVRKQAEEEGLDAIFKSAGAEWRMSGCSMCAGMNGDLASGGERVASTSNRNFVGRQGKGVRTHLVSPSTAASIAICGRVNL
ncbi:3-isopropylmalate dehydratase subunit LeuC [Hyphomicrobiales bacterium]|nr:3-isopropylmalate dehydratase subunit LeuC [Hyphomicrobiales bacterium]CAH1675602.1 3-isopropylmalate dehydratase subunit LeuC [Hyphomicrobiales bacterium]